MHFLVLAMELPWLAHGSLVQGEDIRAGKVKTRVSVATPRQRQVRDGQSEACSPDGVSLDLTYTCKQFYFFPPVL